MNTERDIEFYKRLQEMMVEGGTSRTYTSEVMSTEENAPVIEHYAYCAHMTKDVETFAQRAYNFIKGLQTENEIEYLRRMIG